jgi:hypothetical protein
MMVENMIPQPSSNRSEKAKRLCDFLDPHFLLFLTTSLEEPKTKKETEKQAWEEEEEIPLGKDPLFAVSLVSEAKKYPKFPIPGPRIQFIDEVQKY